MPTKKSTLTDAERAKRIRDAAHELGTANDQAAFERAFAAVAKGIRKPKKQESDKK